MENDQLKLKIAYKQALREAQKNFDKVEKKGNNTRFGKYATYENLFNATYVALSAVGLTISNFTRIENDMMVVVSELTHDLGYSEVSVFPLMPLQAINMTQIQELGKGITYAKRYNFLALTGLSYDGVDDDGESLVTKPGTGYITAKQVQELRDLLEKLSPVDEKRLLKWCQVESLEKIAVLKFAGAKSALLARINKGDENDNE